MKVNIYLNIYKSKYIKFLTSVFRVKHLGILLEEKIVH
jgi:hypothetical protein